MIDAVQAQLTCSLPDIRTRGMAVAEVVTGLLFAGVDEQSRLSFDLDEANPIVKVPCRLQDGAGWASNRVEKAGKGNEGGLKRPRRRETATCVFVDE